MKVVVIRFPIEIFKGFTTVHEEYFINVNAAHDFIKEHNIVEYYIYNKEVSTDEYNMYCQD